MRLLPLLLLFTACGAAPDEASPTGSVPPSPVLLEADKEKARIPTADLELEGTLLLPERTEGEPVPGIVLVHGSGPNSRDGGVLGQLNMGFGFEIEVYRELAEQLRQEGFAVLRYDKRTCTTLSGCDNDYPSPDPLMLPQAFVDDAADALTWLGGHPEVDAERLTVIGHSQGGTFVPGLVDELGLAAGVVLAGAYRPIDEILRFQHDSSDALLADLGYIEEDRAELLVDLAAMVEDVEAVRDGAFDDDDMVWGATAAFWGQWIEMGEEAPDIARGVTSPMLALSGDYDWNVPAGETELWGALFDTLEPDHQWTVLPCITHALNCIDEPDWMQIGTDDIGEEVDTAVSAEIATFLEARL